MDKKSKLLILEGEGQPSERRLGSRMDRTKALNALSAAGAKVSHDSGGRVLVIDASDEVVQALSRALPGARVVDADADVKDSIKNMDETEQLFVEAMKIRTSKSYREAKARRKFGESPEEKELFSGSCVREEY